MEHPFEDQHLEEAPHIDDIFEPTLMMAIAAILLGLGIFAYFF
ncbi:hypothetical protein [Chitinimonas arctica]|nr:hypothetical protein [Chitinimonas arctica]